MGPHPRHHHRQASIFLREAMLGLSKPEGPPNTRPCFQGNGHGITIERQHLVNHGIGVSAVVVSSWPFTALGKAMCALSSNGQRPHLHRKHSFRPCCHHGRDRRCTTAPALPSLNKRFITYDIEERTFLTKPMYVVIPTGHPLLLTPTIPCCPHWVPRLLPHHRQGASRRPACCRRLTFNTILNCASVSVEPSHQLHRSCLGK